MAVKKCPVCGASVKVENLERHVENQHPRAGVDLSTLVTKEEREEAAQERARAAPPRPVVTERGTIIVAVVAVIVVAVFVLVILNPFAGPSKGPGVGQIAPTFNLLDSNGGSFSLDTYRTSPTPQPVLIEFMDVDCGHCQNEASTLVSLYANYSSRARFVSVDVNFVGNPDTNARINQFKQDFYTPWTYVLDLNGIVTQAYGVTGTPTMFILTRTGIVSGVFVGENAYATVAAALDKALV